MGCIWGLPVCLRAGHGLSASTGGTLPQLAVTAPMIPPATKPVLVAAMVRDMQSSGLSTGRRSPRPCTVILCPPLILICWPEACYPLQKHL